jgi:O-antigen/teichoic acid export membrane protein
MKALFITMMTTGLLQFANLGSGMLAAHLLQPAGRGDLAAAILWPTTLSYLALFGLQDATLFHAASGRQTARQIFGAGLLLGSFVTIVAMILGYFVVIPLAYEDYSPQVRSLAVLLLLLIPCTIIGTIYQEMLRGYMRLAIWNAMRVALGVGYLVLILIVYAFGTADVTGFGIAYLLAQSLPLLGGLAVGLRAGWGSWGASVPILKQFAAYGLRIHTSNVVAMLNTKIDQMLIATTLDPASLGLYVVATTMSQISFTVVNSVTMVAYPRACGASPAERPAVIGLYFRLSVIIMLSSTAVLWLIAPVALRLLFGASFMTATPVMRLLLWGAVPFALKDFFVLSFKAYDRALSISKAEVVTLVLNAALLAVLVPKFGLMGAATAFVISRWVSFIYLGLLVRNQLGMALAPLFVPTRADLALAQDVFHRAVNKFGLRV